MVFAEGVRCSGKDFKMSFKTKLQNTLRIDRAFTLVWKASRKWTILSAVVTVLLGVIPLAALYLMKLIVDAVTVAVQTGQGSGDLVDVAYLILAAAGVAVLQAGIRSLGEYVTEGQGAVVTDYVAGILHQKSISLDLAYYESPEYYDTLHRAQREGPYRPTRIVNGLTRLLQSTVSLAAMVGLLFLFHWSVGLLLFVSAVPGVIVQILYARKRFDWQRKRTEEERRGSYLSSVLTLDHFAKEIRLFDLGSHFSGSYDAIRSLLRGEKLALHKKRTIGDFCAQVFAALILMGCFMFIAARALSGAVTLGDMIMFFQAFQRGISSLKEMLSNAAALYEDNMFVSHFFEFLDIQNNIKDPDITAVMPGTAQQGISLENVRFQYPGERDAVIKDVSLTIGPGEVVALVGANGAGKSTLVKLLCRLYDPEEGSITMEGNELSAYPVKELRSRISVVFQDFAKYFLSVKENIRLGDIGLPEDSDKIRLAARKADADGFIRRLPEGYDTMLGRWFYAGEELSLGEWQKIVLARAFLRESNLIILDEPTSSLDVHTEYHLYQKFRELTAGRSALLISHRFSTVHMADRIYVLENGTIAEQGTHAELMALSGIYADMFAKQASWLTETSEE